jgi:hypothetical protein
VHARDPATVRKRASSNTQWPTAGASWKRRSWRQRPLVRSRHPGGLRACRGGLAPRRVARRRTFDGTAGHYGSTRDEILKGLQDGRDAGWLSHNVIATGAAGEFLISVYENEYADGTRVTAAGCARFDDDGKITEIRSMDPR